MTSNVCTPLFSLTHMQKPCHIWAGQESPSIQLLAAKQDLALGQAQPLIAPVRVRAGDGEVCGLKHHRHLRGGPGGPPGLAGKRG